MNAPDTTTRSARVEQRATRRFRQDHTPTPWTCDPEGRITGFDGSTIAACAMHPVYRADDHRMHANARLIVRAVNSHADLLEACRWIIQADADGELEQGPTGLRALSAARAAIAKATGPAPVVPPKFQPEPEDHGQADPLAEALEACDGELELND